MNKGIITQIKSELNKSDWFKEYQKEVTKFHKKHMSYILSKLPKFCERCHTTKRLYLHHEYYIMNLNLNNFKILCSSCHMKHHAEYRRKKIRNIIKKKLDDIENIKIQDEKKKEVFNMNRIIEMCGFNSNEVRIKSFENTHKRNIRRIKKRNGGINAKTKK